MKLIKCSEYVIEQDKLTRKDLHSMHFHHRVVKYVKFLKRLLELWMFIPCDKDGNVLEKPESWERYNYNCNFNGALKDWQLLECKQYQESLDRVIFKGVVDFFELKGQEGYRFYAIDGNQIFNICEDGSGLYWHFETIEDLCGLGLELTKSRTKLIQ